MESVAGLRLWAEQFLPAEVALAGPVSLTPIAGDAGFRKYFRVNSTPGLIAVHAPPDKENTPAFVAKDLALRAGGIRCPAVCAVDFSQGYMLQEDLGDSVLLGLLDSSSMARLYHLAEGVLADIQHVARDDEIFPPYDRPLLLQEMTLFSDWFVERLLGVKMTDDDRGVVDETFALLVKSAIEQPQVVVHRDYHSRNLLLCDGNDVGVVDFQDAVIGPFTYDLVSLLKDCYIRWPVQIVRERALAFLSAHAARLGIADAPATQLLKWFDFMGLQRHIKVLGIFARLWLRDGKSRYLDDLPLVLRYTLEVTGEYPELARFNQWFTQRLLPLLPDQSWYRDWRLAGDTSL